MSIPTNIPQDVNFGTVDAGVIVGIDEVCNWIIGDCFLLMAWRTFCRMYLCLMFVVYEW